MSETHQQLIRNYGKRIMQTTYQFSPVRGNETTTL